MCIVSDKLKLCTCSDNELETLDHYWVYYGFVAGKEEYIVGMPLLPYELNADLTRVNYDTLLHLLNEQNPFDIAIDPKVADRLLLSFTCGEATERVYYGFQYNGTKWRQEAFDAFEWLSKHEQTIQGKVLQALKR